MFLIIHRTGGLWAGILSRQHIPSNLLCIMLRRSSDTMEVGGSVIKCRQKSPSTDEMKCRCIFITTTSTILAPT